MPYRSVSEAEERNPGIRNLPPKAKRAWVSAFNSAKEQGKDDETAAKIAWSVANRIREKMEASVEVRGDTLAIGIPFQKIDVRNRTVEGFATLDNVDSAGEIVDFEASREAFKNWMGNIREMHGPKAVGKALKVEEREKEEGGTKYRGMYVKAYISKGAQDTWEKILDGTLRGFSLGGRVLEKRPEIIKSDGSVYARRQVVRITKYMLGELSVVDNPANPLAVFEGVEKGVPVAALVKFSDGKFEATDVLGSDEEIEERNVYYCERCDVAKVSQTDDASCPTCDAEMEHIATSYELIGEEEVKKMVEDHRLKKLQEEPHDDEGKAEPEDVNYRIAEYGYSCAGCLFYKQNLGACEKVKYDISANYVCDLFEERTEEDADIEPTEVYNNVTQINKRDFSAEERRRLAREGLALPDGSYPIVTVEDLKNAIRAYGRAGNKAEVKRWIIRRARALGRTDLLPDEWKESMNKSDLQTSNDDGNNLTNILEGLIKSMAEKIAKADPAETGGDIENVDKTSLSRILEILKSAVGNVEEILAKAGVVRLNDEDAERVDHVENVSLPASEPPDNAAPGKVETDGVGAAQEAWAEPPSEANVLPHAFGKAETSEEDLALVKSVITEEIGKLSGKLDAAFEAVEKRFNEFAERIEKLENSGATKKSVEVNRSEELKKSRDSFWGGKFFSGDL